MINHGRTLLLNKSGATRPHADFFLEEYVDPDFRPLQLPGFLSAARRVLIGDADDAFSNFRLAQFVDLLHSTEFVSYLTALDPRITYRNKRSILDENYDGQANALNDEADIPVAFEGEISSSPASPRLWYQWDVEVLDGVTVRSRFGTQVFEETVTIENNLTSLIHLAGQKAYGFRLAVASLPVGAHWYMSKLLRPNADVVDLLGPLELLGDEVISQLFGTAEPYKTFKQLWDRHGYISYRLSGFLLAYIYRVEEVRLGS